MLVVDRPLIIGIYLRPEPGKQLRIGTLLRDDSGVVTFLVDEGYIALGPERPLVSMAWYGTDEADSVSRLRARGDKIMQGGYLPAFFQNMLPEGILRDIVAKEFVHGAFDQADVLAFLGGDLPGAIVAQLEAGKPARRAPPEEQKDQGVDGAVADVRFSLAGQQMKFSAISDRKSITVPAMGKEGELILKTPSDNPKFRYLPEIEYASMQLAEAAGVRTAECWLVESSSVSGIAEPFLKGGDYALAVKRFDRAPGGIRIQIEDFAQIFGALPDAKYSTGNEATILNATRRFCTDSRGELLEAVRRFIVAVLVGDGDRHLKNTSLMLGSRDGLPEVSLTPAYDVVSTYLLHNDQRMAMKLGGTDDPWRYDVAKLERAAGLLKVEPKVIIREAKRTVERARDLWPKQLQELPIPTERKRKLVDRIEKLPLANELSPKPVKGVEFPEDEAEPVAAPKP
ncbi:type II toxin-antitoxin system HipA family toxin [Bosea sp. ANAM02]|uniref:type II toxin-antitoxin system HipA family toxin n=1 Tax=Bosea sp. ANAM02 TaxID=2020412 RepID=UPI00140EEBB3|nr:type II toxin-antitoxin system HipA family toxin [Bosea sp. ANAM02]BCB22183.1 putative kinase Y4dM [Bosea sp. ANAM02]